MCLASKQTLRNIAKVSGCLGDDCNLPYLRPRALRTKLLAP
jgi:hypothetical protein